MKFLIEFIEFQKQKFKNFGNFRHVAILTWNRFESFEPLVLILVFDCTLQSNL